MMGSELRSVFGVLSMMNAERKFPTALTRVIQELSLLSCVITVIYSWILYNECRTEVSYHIDTCHPKTFTFIVCHNGNLYLDSVQFDSVG